MRLLANENFPRVMVEALVAEGHDVIWIRTSAPGSIDEDILARSVAESRILLTFDKDFGELTFRAGHEASAGIILFRIDLSNIDEAVELVIKTINSRQDWAGHFTTVSNKRIRMRALN
ncbi:MAG: DUF5615 family PIN-like protein [Gemmatales bacterium]